MAEKIPMLALSPTMEQGTIVTWVKKEGETVKSGDVLCEVETDKATMEYETTANGTLLKILTPEGAKAGIGDAIAIIGSPGEDISSLLKEVAVPAAPKPAPVSGSSSSIQNPKSKIQNQESPAPSLSATSKASPLARKLAAQLGVDISTVSGTGPSGRIVERDIVKGMAARPASAQHAQHLLEHAPDLEEKTIPVTPKRDVIAKRTSQSAFTAPHYYLTVSVNMDAIVVTREELKEGGQNISLNAFLLRFAAEALKHNPAVNASWMGQTIELHGHADIAMAVAQPDGLVAPVVRSCDTKSVSQIDSELRPLVEDARTGKLSAEAYAKATFTISNLGTFDVDQFTAIINPPASAILAVGKVQLSPTVNQHTGAIEAHHMMKLTLSCDHRVIDGAIGAKFLHDLKAILESPALALL